jgi:uncharacterized tellurite resistance protein B-like protein
MARIAAMSWRDWLRGDAVREEGLGSGAVRRIAAELAALPPEQARYLAAFAYLLGRVAHADREVTEAETARMEELVRTTGAVSPEQATLVVEIAKAQNRLFGHVENFLVTRELREGASEVQRRALLDCLFAVSAAEDGISGEEEAQVRQIASELGFSHPEYVAARAAWSEHRNVLRGLRRD